MERSELEHGELYYHIFCQRHGVETYLPGNTLADEVSKERNALCPCNEKGHRTFTFHKSCAVCGYQGEEVEEIANMMFCPECGEEVNDYLHG